MFYPTFPHTKAFLCLTGVSFISQPEKRITDLGVVNGFRGVVVNTDVPAGERSYQTYENAFENAYETTADM
jgi:hypothetical protein